MPLGHCYTITRALLREFLKAFLWRVLREFEIYGRAKMLRVAYDILQKMGFASRKLDGSRE
jgi:hypothetical protein